ncbi:MAG: hypothetical protein AB1898_17720 [Acidobacteriota bacterium]
MQKVKLSLTLAATLTLAAQQTAAPQTAVTYWTAGGSGCIRGDHPGTYVVSVSWKYPGVPGALAEKGGVNFKEYEGDDLECTANGLTAKTPRMVYQIVTDKYTKPTIIESNPKNEMVKYSSQGSCGPTLTTNMTPIVVTVTGGSLTVECGSYNAAGTTNKPIVFTRYR